MGEFKFNLNKKRSGFSAIEVIIVIVIVALVAGGAWFVFSKRVAKDTSNSSADSSKKSDSNVSWDWDGEKWQSSGTPPDCDNPVILKTPVDINQVTTILYPGQFRGGDYKPHGGFRFGSSNAIKVTAPLDAKLVQASRYIESGETQTLLEFVNSCGIMYRFDHLLTLSPAMQAAVDKIPAPKQDDSRTTRIKDKVTVKAGDEIATAVGFIKTKNVSVDFGVYDLRKPNEASQSEAYKSAHQGEESQAFYGVCWFDLLPSSDASIVKALPGGDSTSAKTSDYCK